jgi:hypothetical protein
MLRILAKVKVNANSALNVHLSPRIGLIGVFTLSVHVKSTQSVFFS